MDICINGHLRLRLDSIGLMVYQPEFSIWTSMDRLSHRGIFVIDMMISTVNRYPLLSWLLNMDIYLEISHKWIFLIYIYSSFWMYIIHLPLQGIEGSVTASAFSWEWTHDHSIIHPMSIPCDQNLRNLFSWNSINETAEDIVQRYQANIANNRKLTISIAAYQDIVRLA